WFEPIWKDFTILCRKAKIITITLQLASRDKCLSIELYLYLEVRLLCSTTVRDIYFLPVSKGIVEPPCIRRVGFVEGKESNWSKEEDKCGEEKKSVPVFSIRYQVSSLKFLFVGAGSFSL